MGLVDILYQVLASPSAAFSLIREKTPFRWAIPAVILPSLVFSLVLLPNPPELAEVILGLDKGTLGNPALWIIWLAILPLILVIQAGLIHGVAVLLHGRGSYGGMFCGICFASFPWVFFAPLALLRALLDSSVGYVIYDAGSTVFFGWILVLYIIAIRHNYGFSVRRAAATCFIPAFLMFGVPLLAVVISMAF